METEAGDNVVENGGSGGAAEMEVAVAMAVAVWRCGGSGVALWRCGLRGGVAQWHGAVAVGYACSWWWMCVIISQLFVTFCCVFVQDRQCVSACLSGFRPWGGY